MAASSHGNQVVTVPLQNSMNISRTMSNRDSIVVLHGIASSRWHTWVLAHRLKRTGATVFNRGYPSIRKNISWHGKRFYDFLDGLQRDDQFDSIYVVAHSMGCQVARAALLHGRPEKVRRMVMLAPPNHGSTVARHLSRVLGFCQTLAELSDAPDSYVRGLPADLDLEFGVIASSKDHVVRMESTHLPGQSDHVIVDAHHMPMLFHQTTVEYVAHFLDHGMFPADARRQVESPKPDAGIAAA